MKRLLLVGGGHAQLSVLRRLARHPLQNTEVTLITPSAYQYYSGMLPGWLVGQYAEDQCRIDLRPLAQKAGVRLLLNRITMLAPESRYVVLANGQQVVYDLLSLDIGSNVRLDELKECGELLLPAKPLEAFYSTAAALLNRSSSATACRIGVVGGGAAGVELALATRHRLGMDTAHHQVMLITGHRGLLPGYGSRARDRITRRLQAAGVELLPQRALGHAQGLQLDDGRLLILHAVIATSGAAAPHWLRSTGLRLNAEGFIAVDAIHRSLSHPNIFAVGDICARPNSALARSGVHAVHVGPVLARNLLAVLSGTTLKSYRPRSNPLYLLSLGDGRALLSWGRLSVEGAWVWRWKDRIDRGFIGRHSLPQKTNV